MKFTTKMKKKSCKIVFKNGKENAIKINKKRERHCGKLFKWKRKHEKERQNKVIKTMFQTEAEVQDERKMYLQEAKNRGSTP